MQQMLRTEHGGMNEVLADLYAELLGTVDDEAKGRGAAPSKKK